MAASPLPLPSPPIAFDRPQQVRAAIVVLAFVGAFWNVLADMSYAWLNQSDWSHGFAIPFFSLWLVYLRWDQIKKTPVAHTWIGLLLMLVTLAVYQLSLWGMIQFVFARPLAMWFCVLGVIIFLCGLPVVRHVWVPWAYLAFAIPWPQRYYSLVTDYLRRFAATLVSAVLGLIPSLEIHRTGAVLEYFYKGQGGRIGVEDACSGMRSTVTLCALGVAVAFMSDRPVWQRIIMVLSCVPIAIFCNFLRVTITCIVHIFIDPQYAQGTYHHTLGIIMILVAFGLFSALGWVLQHMVVEEKDEPEPANA